MHKVCAHALILNVADATIHVRLKLAVFTLNNASQALASFVYNVKLILLFPMKDV